MRLIEAMIDSILPPRCIVTGEIIERHGMISAEAWGSLHFISDPQCNRCGFPFEFDDGQAHEANICLGCLKSPPVFDKARSALVYDDASRDLVLSYKHGDQTDYIATFIPWLEMAAGRLIDQADYIIPVPLHRWRLIKRRFNQSALIAKYLADETKTCALLDGLIRNRHTVTQGKLQAKQRLKNVKNAFEVNPKYLDKVQGKSIILIDDVYTTGATVNECTKVLKKTGASSVNILTLARVVKPQRD